MLLDEQHAEIARAAQFDDGVLDFRDDRWLDALGGFVEDEHARFGDERSSDGELLSLTTGQQAGASVEERDERGEEFEHARDQFLAVLASVGDDLQVLGAGELTERLLALRHVCEAARDAGGGSQAGDVLAVEEDLSSRDGQ